MKKHLPPAPMRAWLPGQMSDDVSRMLWRLRRIKDVRRLAIMPDVHLASDVCVGSVLATENLVYPSAVGGDIGCGMAAMPFDAVADVLDAHDNARSLLEGLAAAVPIIRRHSAWPCDWLAAAALSDPALDRQLWREGHYELGTLGRGNHFLEFQEDLADGRLWVMVHTGSRCMGQAIRDQHVARADGSSFGLPYLLADGPAGGAYLRDQAWARGYAAVSRGIILAATAELVRKILGVHAGPVVANRDHNHVMRERHFDGWLWVHRKGANRARPGELCLIPGSMGTQSVHAVGRGQPESLRSSSHGAGRMLSRTAARQRVSLDQLARQMEGVYYRHNAADQLRDEAPAAYKDLDKVMRAQRELVHVCRRLRPVLSYKG